MITYRTTLASSLLVAALACDRDPPAARVEHEPLPLASPAATPSTSVPEIPAAPVAEHSKTPSPIGPVATPEEPAAPTPTAATDSALVLVAERPQANSEYAEMTLGMTSDRQVLAAAGPMLLKLSADGDIEHDPSWVRGIDPTGFDLEAVQASMFWWNATAVGGVSVDEAYLVMTRGTGSRGDGTPPEVYRRNNAVWTRIATHRGKLDWFPRAFGPWKDGSLLALRGFDPSYAPNEDGPTEAEQHAFLRAVAREKKLVVLRGLPKAPAFGAKDVQAFASLPTGQIWAVIADGDERRMLHYDDATGSETMHPLPGKGMWTIDVRATTPERVWAFGVSQDDDDQDTGWLARFDGTAWVRVATKCIRAVTSLSIDDQGNVYFACGIADDSSKSALFRWRDGAIEELPMAASPTLVVARTPSDVWVLAAQFEDPARLFHTGTSRKQPFVMPTPMAAAEAVLEWADPLPITSRCNRAWIPIVAGSDMKAIPESLDALAEKEWYPEIVEARVHGRTEQAVALYAVPEQQFERAVKTIVARLGKAAGTPTCNARPVPVRNE